MRNALYLHLYQEDGPALCIEELPKGRLVAITQAYALPDLTLMKDMKGQVYVHRISFSSHRGLGQYAPITDSMLRALTGLKVITKQQADEHRALHKKWKENRDAYELVRAARESLKACGIAVPVTIERQLKKLEGAK